MPGRKGGTHKSKPKIDTEGVPRFRNGQALQKWAFDAYTANIGRCQSVLSLARQFGCSPACVRRNIDAIHAAVLAAENSDAIEVTERHRARLQEVARAAWQDYAKADVDKRPAFLRIALDAAQQLAASEGLITKREQHDHNLNVGSFPVPVFSENDPVNHFAAPGQGTDAPAPDDAG
jgi:hypothetical protein